MVLCSNCDLTADRWLSIGKYANHAFDTFHALSIHAVTKQLWIQWLVRKQFIE